ncbi:MAG TPA: PAS domain-containing protein [Pontiellaceae bacterium]|nr:PAS domain-containing protein [Pontiellaceae bacterium]
MNLHKRIFLRKTQLLKLINGIPGTVYHYRQWKNGRCTFPYSSLDIEELFFATPVELAKNGEIAWDRVCPEFKDLVRNTLNRSAENLKEFEITFRVRSPQGRMQWIRNRAVPERLRDGSTLWYGHMQNVTAQYEAEEGAKQKSALLNVIFETLPDHIYYMDRESRMLGANPACCNHHKKTAEEMIGKTDIELYPNSIGRKLYDEEQQLMTDAQTLREREKHVDDKGRIIHLESVKIPLRSPSGRIIGLAGISRDITEQVEREEALLQAKHAAEQSTAFIKAIFDNLEDSFYYKDRQSRVLGGNRAWVTSRGAKSIDELIGKTDIDLHPAPLGQQLYDNEQRQMAEGEVTRIRERHIRKDGSIGYVEAVKCPMRDEKGEVIGLAGISRDITRQVENEKRLVEAQQEAEAANKAKSAFLAMMSHEIRTPMNGVIGAASLLLGTELTAQQDEFVHTIQVSGENLMTIINDILDYSKIEAGKIELEKAPFELRECIEDAFDLFIQAAAKKNVELLYYVDPDVPKALLGDTTRIRQILVNLLGNAIKFTENGEVTLKVHNVTTDENKRQCQLEFAVHDTGIGIADEHKVRLFEAFTQADASSTRKYGGTGLGLTISRRLTELMDGKIWFESEKGKGSTFFFTLTLPITDHVDPKAEHLPVEALRGKRALIVDDNETNRWLLSDQLAQWGVLSEAFAEPEKALQHLKNGGRYDIALIDFQMPCMDGSDLAKQIYRIKTDPHIPVIILSSSCEHIPADPSIRARLSKPVKISKLCDQMLQALAEQRTGSAGEETAGTQIQPKKLRNLRVLVAEDNPINQRIAQMMLQRIGCEKPVIVSDGEEAVAAVMDAAYDVILMDIQMPRMNGLDATRQIRKHTGDPEKPWVIALSAGVMREEQTAALEAGMNEFLSKPLVIEHLEKTLDHVLLS